MHGQPGWSVLRISRCLASIWGKILHTPLKKSTIRHTIYLDIANVCTFILLMYGNNRMWSVIFMAWFWDDALIYQHNVSKSNKLYTIQLMYHVCQTPSILFWNKMCLNNINGSCYWLAANDKRLATYCYIKWLYIIKFNY